MGGNEWPDSSGAAIQLHLLSHPSIWRPNGLPCWFSVYNSTSSIISKSWLHCLVLTSRNSVCVIGDDSSLSDRAPKIFYQAHSFMLTYRSGNSEAHKGAQKTSLSPPPSLLHRHTHLSFHPKETVRIQTNRGDGYCPNAIILYCPSPWLLGDKGPSVDEASSVWIGG